MTTQQENEMASIFRSFEWLMKPKLIELDAIARKMFSEMSACNVPKHMHEPYCAAKTQELILQVAREEGEASVKRNRELRGGKTKYP